MNGLDRDALEGVRNWAQRRVDFYERQRRMAPLHEAMQRSTEAMITESSPELMAGPTAQVRRSVLAMEKSHAEWPEKLRIEDERRGRDLARVRRRTAALRSWLESLP